MEIKLTGIGKENVKSFEPLMLGFSPEDEKLSVGAIVDDKAVGVALFDFLDESLMLDHIYVAEKYRRSGIATKMILDTIDALRPARPSALHVNYPETSEDLHGLFLSLGFKLFRDGKSYRIPAKDILDTPAFNKVTSGKIKHRISKVKDIIKKEKNTIWQAFENANLDADLIENRSLSEDLSLVAFDGESGDPESIVLCQESENEVSILYLVNFKHDTIALVDMIHALSDAIVEKKGEDCDILFVTMDDKMEAFARTLVGEEDEFGTAGAVISGIMMI